MVKTINIGGNEYNLKSSAYTMFAYKNDTGRDLLKDLNTINDKFSKIGNISEEEKNEMYLTEITNIIEMALKLAYTMIRECNGDFKAYNDWLKELDCLMNNNMSWINEVLEVGIAPFFGRISNAPKQQ